MVQRMTPLVHIIYGTPGRSFQIPVHWHDELEIIYVKSGCLTVNIIRRELRRATKRGMRLSCRPRVICHLMGTQTGAADYFTFLFPLKYIYPFVRMTC